MLRNLVFIGVILAAASTAGWFTINREGDQTTIQINRSEIRDDARRAIDRGREYLDQREQQLASQRAAQGQWGGDFQQPSSIDDRRPYPSAEPYRADQYRADPYRADPYQQTGYRDQSTGYRDQQGGYRNPSGGYLYPQPEYLNPSSGQWDPQGGYRQPSGQTYQRQYQQADYYEAGQGYRGPATDGDQGQQRR